MAGAGAIGSALALHLARLPALREITIVDPARYDASNLAGQMIERGDVGRLKVAVTAGRIRRTNPRVTVQAIARRIEDVPLGRLRADVILGCLDSREARCAVNRAALRLGIPWIDAGVEPHGGLVRLSVFRPGTASACYECQLSDRDYERLGVVWACGASGPVAQADAPAHRVPAALGALAASLQAISLDTILAGAWDRVAVGHTTTLAAADRVLDVVEIRPNAACRCAHEPWTIVERTGSVATCTIEDALRFADSGPAHADAGGGRRSNGRRSRSATETAAGASLRVVDRPFVREIACPSCGSSRTLLRLLDRVPRAIAQCSCGARRQPNGFATTDRLHLGDLSPRERTRTLASLGFEPGEVFTIDRNGAESHHVLLEGSDATCSPCMTCMTCTTCTTCTTCSPCAADRAAITHASEHRRVLA